MNFIIDMNISPRLCEILRRRGHDAVHWSAIGPLTAPDNVIIDRARLDGRVIITHDLDYTAILATSGSTSPSVVQVRTQDVLSSHFEELLLDAIQRFSPDLEKGALVVIDDERSRVRVLPLR